MLALITKNAILKLHVHIDHRQDNDHRLKWAFNS